MEKIIEEKLPENLINKIINQYGEELSNKIFNAYCSKKNVSLRVNSLKSNKEEVIKSVNSIPVYSRNGIYRIYGKYTK